MSGSHIFRLTGLSKPTVIRMLSELRTICSNKILNAGVIKDRRRRKDRRDRRVKVRRQEKVPEREGIRVPDRTRETLVHRLITTHILRGTVIYPDQFSPYIPLNQVGYIHLSVNHLKNFVDPDSGAHTNTIEGLWALVKKKLKSMSGTLYEHLPSYLDEFVWFRNFAGDRAFAQLLEDVAE